MPLHTSSRLTTVQFRYSLSEPVNLPTSVVPGKLARIPASGSFAVSIPGVPVTVIRSDWSKLPNMHMLAEHHFYSDHKFVSFAVGFGRGGHIYGACQYGGATLLHLCRNSRMYLLYRVNYLADIASQPQGGKCSHSQQSWQCTTFERIPWLVKTCQSAEPATLIGPGASYRRHRWGTLHAALLARCSIFDRILLTRASNIRR